MNVLDEDIWADACDDAMVGDTSRVESLAVTATARSDVMRHVHHVMLQHCKQPHIAEVFGNIRHTHTLDEMITAAETGGNTDVMIWLLSLKIKGLSVSTQDMDEEEVPDIMVSESSAQ